MFFFGTMIGLVGTGSFTQKVFSQSLTHFVITTFLERPATSIDLKKVWSQLLQKCRGCFGG